MTTLATSSSTLALLPRFGPDADSAETPSPAEALAYCRRLARSHEENFPVLSRLLDPTLVDPFAAVYAFCRWADDLADERPPNAAVAASGPDEARSTALGLLEWWRRQTIAWHGGETPTHPVFVGLAAVSERLRVPLPLGPFLDLIDAFEQDQRVTRYETWEELLGYCAKSANPVGRLVLALGGAADAGASIRADMPTSLRQTLEQSDALCTALQLTNFWQDVRRDLLDRDRVYLPRALTGLDAPTLRDYIKRPNDPRARVPYILAIRPLVERTDQLFQASRTLPLLVAQSIARPVSLFHAAGAATLHRIEAIGCATLWKRPTLSRAGKLTLLARTWLGGGPSRGRSG